MRDQKNGSLLRFDLKEFFLEVRPTASIIKSKNAYVIRPKSGYKNVEAILIHPIVLTFFHY